MTPVATVALQRYRVKLPFNACPEARDWFVMQDANDRGEVSVSLPPQCEMASPGEHVLAALPGKRPTITRAGHAYQQGQFEDGRLFWTDGMDDSSIVASRG